MHPTRLTDDDRWKGLAQNAKGEQVMFYYDEINGLMEAEEVQKLDALRKEINKGIMSLDNGEGKPLNIEEIKDEARRVRYTHQKPLYCNHQL